MTEKKDLKDPNKSKNNPFKAHKLCQDIVQGHKYFRIQIPSEIAKDFPEESCFYIGHKPGTQDIQLFQSGTSIANPIKGNIERPKKLKQESFITGAGTSIQPDDKF